MKRPAPPQRQGPRRSAQRNSPARARLQHHRAMASDSLLRLWRAPLSSLMTIIVIAIALLLPALLAVVMKNMSGLGSGIENISQISLYMRADVGQERILALAGELREAPDVSAVEYISAEQALEEFSRESGFGDVVSALESNPLPATLVVFPRSTDPQISQRLFNQLAALPEVELAQLDLQWLQRLQAMMSMLARAVVALAVILSLAVLLVIGNTIRMAIEGRRAEIGVVKLVGGSNSFVARPFLYTGFWYGLLGGSLAWLALLMLLLMFAAPLTQLLALYGSAYQLQGAGAPVFLLLLGGGALLGWLGALLSVMQHLSAIEPR